MERGKAILGKKFTLRVCNVPFGECVKSRNGKISREVANGENQNEAFYFFWCIFLCTIPLKSRHLNKEMAIPHVVVTFDHDIMLPSESRGLTILQSGFLILMPFETHRKSKPTESKPKQFEHTRRTIQRASHHPNLY